MYSRNIAGRGRSSIDDEYELYGYNLPPIYDGNRFNGVHDEEDTEEDEGEELPDRTEEAVTSASAREKHPSKFRFPEIDSEELLLLSVIFIISGEGCADDTVLMLALILLSGMGEK